MEAMKKKCYCIKCHNMAMLTFSEMDDGAKFCPQCGTELDYAEKPCRHCGKSVYLWDTNCKYCGKELVEEVTVLPF